MNQMDVPIALPDFEIIKNFKQFTLIYPSTHALAKNISIEMRLRLLAFTEEDYFALLQKDIEFDKVEPEGGKYYDIAYIRETYAMGVSNKEWALCYGPDTLRSFCSKTKSEPTSYVKVISLIAPRYSLKELNKQIRNSR